MKKLNPLINELEKIYWQEMSLCNISTKSNGTLFFNKFCGSKIKEDVTVSFKLNDHSILPIKGINKLQINR